MYTINKHKTLLAQDRRLFHTRDLALLWGIKNENTLRTTISRYLKNGTFVSLHKGLYATIAPARLDMIELGRAMIHGMSYLSCESVLVSSGVIHQELNYLTFVGERSATLTLPRRDMQIKVRQLAPRFLFNPLGITDSRADLERAAADLLYYNPRYHLDSPQLIDQTRLLSYQKELGYI